MSATSSSSSFHVCVSIESHTQATRGPLDSRRSLLGVTHFCRAVTFLFPLLALEEPNKPCGLRTLHTSDAIIPGRVGGGGGAWPVIPAENNTSFSPVKPSVRPHHREQALRIHDVISLPGRFSIQFSTQHRSAARSFSTEGGGGELVIICCREEYLEKQR